MCCLYCRLCTFGLWTNQRRMIFLWNCKGLQIKLINWFYIWTIVLNQLTYMCFLFSCRSKLHTYDDVVERVAHQLGLDDPSKIRLTSHNCYSQQPKPQPIRYRGVEHLLDMLVHYNQVEFSFFVYSLSALLHLETWHWFMLLSILMLHSRLLISCIMRFWTFHCQNCSVWKHLKLHSTMQQKTRFVSCLSLVPMLIFYS